MLQGFCVLGPGYAYYIAYIFYEGFYLDEGFCY
jgi:hypothetical protein